MRQVTLENIPVELVEVLGNFIRKTAYTQLKAVRVVGIGIGENDSRMALPTSTIEGTTTLLDIICKLTDCNLKASRVQELEEKIQSTSKGYYVIETSFTNLKETLSEYLDVDMLPDDLLITSAPHLLRLQVMEIEHDMCSNSLQAHISDGVVPIPCSVLSDFKLDYSEKSAGILTYTIAEECADQLQMVLNDLKQSISPRILN